MKADLEGLKSNIEQLNIANDEKEVMLQSLGKIEKELKTLNFKLQRTSKEKKTLSTLLSRTSDDLDERKRQEIAEALSVATRVGVGHSPYRNGRKPSSSRTKASVGYAISLEKI